MVTYSLLNGKSSSEEFYTDLSLFTNEALERGNACLGKEVLEYCQFVDNKNIEPLRRSDEYLLELIMLGIFWRNYIHNANKTKFISKFLVKRLHEIRSLNPSMKTTVDVIRGVLAYELLNHQQGSEYGSFSIRELSNLVEWLAATGEFKEEALRLEPWIRFFKFSTQKFTETTLRKAVEFAGEFAVMGEKALGQYLSNIPQFHAKRLVEYRHKEDYFLVARKENEYLLNMFGAEVMNRHLREKFEQKPNKALLLPTCMRNQPYDGCKAVSDGKELVCAQCFSKCNIGKVAAEMKEQNIKTYLIPHSSDFSRFLKNWENSSDTALIGVACVLNLLTGGYEMKRLGIASQCIFLDYSSCKKHWDKDGEPTNLSITQLKRVAETDALVIV